MVYNALTSKSFELNEPASFIFSLCDGTLDIDEIADRFSVKFKMRLQKAKKNVNAYLSQLEEKKILTWRTSRVERVEIPKPKYMIFEVTNRCNLNCIHCSVLANERRCQELTTEEWENLIKELAEMGTEAIGLSGGEPLLRTDIFVIAQSAVNLGLQVGLVTNGLLLNEYAIAEIKRMNLDVQVSLDGSKPWLHDKIRSSDGCFEILKEKLNLLKENEVPFTVAMVATAMNYSDLPELIELSEKFGASRLRVQPFFPVGRGDRRRDELILNAGMAKEISVVLNENAKWEGIDAGGFYLQFVLEDAPDAPANPCTEASCAAGYDFGGITPDGYVYPCSHIWPLGTDNVREHSFSWIWRNSKLFNFFRSLKREDINDFCQSCKYFEKCRGGCRAMNILDWNIFSTDRHCWLAEEETK